MCTMCLHEICINFWKFFGVRTMWNGSVFHKSSDVAAVAASMWHFRKSCPLIAVRVRQMMIKSCIAVLIVAELPDGCGSWQRLVQQMAPLTLTEVVMVTQFTSISSVGIRRQWHLDMLHMLYLAGKLPAVYVMTVFGLASVSHLSNTSLGVWE